MILPYNAPERGNRSMTDRLDGPRWGPAEGGAPQKLVLLIHGLGADGFDLIDLAPGWGKAVPGALFIAPHGLEPCDLAPHGRQWFSVQDRTPARMEAGARAASARLTGALDAELAALGLTRADCALMGFSQGAMTALFMGLRMAPPPAVILAYSGCLLGAETLPREIAARPPVLLVHGEADDVVPVQGSRQAEAALKALAVPVEAVYRPGLAHGLDEAGIALGGLALQRHLGSQA
jgi:phospholipase/carboxylesterase